MLSRLNHLLHKVQLEYLCRKVFINNVIFGDPCAAVLIPRPKGKKGASALDPSHGNRYRKQFPDLFLMLRQFPKAYLMLKQSNRVCNVKKIYRRISNGKTIFRRICNGKTIFRCISNKTISKNILIIRQFLDVFLKSR